jgi:hypothetical protein
METIPTMIYQCVHVPDGAFAQILPGATFEGAPLCRIENWPKSYVLALSNKSVAVWCTKCYAIKAKSI